MNKTHKTGCVWIWHFFTSPLSWKVFYHGNFCLINLTQCVWFYGYTLNCRMEFIYHSLEFNIDACWSRSDIGATATANTGVRNLVLPWICMYCKPTHMLKAKDTALGSYQTKLQFSVIYTLLEGRYFHGFRLLIYNLDYMNMLFPIISKYDKNIPWQFQFRPYLSGRRDLCDYN